MALQKVPVSLNLLSGADTKMNEQIQTSYKDMVNVVFSGNQTAKKMKGYDLLATLPAGEQYSSIFTRERELLFQTDKGSYKYYEIPSDIYKIDSVGSTEVDKLSSYGEVTCVADDYVMHISTTREGNILPGNDLQVQNLIVYTFTDTAGNVLNKIEIPCSMVGQILDNPTVFRWIKPTKFGNDFFSMGFDSDGFGTSNGDIYLKKFTYDIPTNTFIVAATKTYVGEKYINLKGFDIYTDGTSLIAAFQAGGYAGGAVLRRLNYTTLVETHSVPLYSGDPAGLSSIWTSLHIFQRDSGTIYITSSTIPAADGVNTFLNLAIYQKSNLVFVSSNIVQTRLGTPSTNNFHWLPIPISDSQVYAMGWTNGKLDNPAALVGQSFSPIQRATSYFNDGDVSNFAVYNNASDGLMPISNIFIENGEYYAFFCSQLGLNSVFMVVRIKDGVPVATFCASKTPQESAAQNNDPRVIKVWNLAWKNASDWFGFVAGNAYKSDGKWYLSVRKTANKGELFAVSEFYSVDFNAYKTNTQIEIVGKAHIFNGQPAYYDGKDLSEFGFNNRPVIQGGRSQAVTGTSSLPATGDYQFAAVYKWKDASGNVFYSDLSNIMGPMNVQNAVGTPTAIFIQPNAPLVTTKENVIVELYMKKDADQFRLVRQYAYEKGLMKEIDPPATTGIRIYPPDAGAIFLPFTGTFVAGGDYPTSVLTDSIASAIYEDRVFTVSKDNPISIPYSQQKLQGWGTEFNQDIFYIDVYDKRGVNEDDLTGLIAMDGRLFIFKQRSILYIVGSGPSRANTGDDISSPQLVTTDVGCVWAKSLVLVPDGIMFMSDKGIYILNRKLQVTYLGSNVERFNGNTVTSAILLEYVNEVRFTTSEGELLVYNYLENAWSWFVGLPAVGACIWKNKYVILLTDGRVFAESDTHNKIVQNGVSTEIIQTISTPWIRGEEIQNWEKVYETLILGYYKSPHQLKLSVYYDYELFVSEEYTIDPLDQADYNVTIRPTNQELESGAKTNGVYQMRIDMIRKNCQAFRIVIQDIPEDVENNTGECFALSNITTTVGAKQGPAKLPAAKSY